MVRNEIGDGVVIILPEGAAVAGPPAGRRGGVTRSPGVSPASDLVTDALEAGGFELAAEVELVVAQRAAVRSSQPGSASVDLTVAEGESAVILLEEPGGVFRWSHPTDTVPLPARRSGGGGVLLRFDLSSPAGGASADRRGLPNVGALLDRTRVKVLRYVAAKGIDVAIDRLEGGALAGLVIIGEDPAGWVPSTARPAWPSDRPARVLLMVHGTFSSTLGSFIGLTRTEEGRRFLTQARAHYDAILGFDHPTLAQTVEQNAEAMMAALAAAGLPRNTMIDAVAYSRGGLVYRVFAEETATRDRPDLSFGRVVFVGCTNGGTNLASPANWATLADVYVNVLVAAAGLLTTVSSPLVSAAMASAVRTLGQLVKIIPQVAIDDHRVPGLASMLPAGPTVTRLNGAADRPDATTRYYAVTSNFRATRDARGKLSKELMEFFADRVTDRLFAADNDLVVHVSSMTEFGGRVGRFSPDATFSFGSDDAMYHTRYFDVGETPDKLIEWLQIPTPSGRRKLSDTLPDTSFHRGAEPEPTLEAPVEIAMDLQPELEVASPSRRSPPTTGAPRMRGGRATSEPPSEAPAPRVSTGLDTRSPPSPAEPASRHFAAETQPTPRLGGACAVFVTMSPQAIRVIEDAASATTSGGVAVDRSDEIVVTVIGRVNCDVIGECEKSIPAGIDTCTLRFEIEGREPGAADLLIEVRQGPTVLTSLTLAPVFVERVDVLRVEQSVTAPARGSDAPMMLRIYEIHQADKSLRLRFDLSGSNPNVSILDHVELGAGLDVSSFVATFLADLENAWNISGASYDQFVERLSASSIVAAEQLMPRSIRKALWEHRDEIEAVQIISEQPSIPWELLYITDPDGQDDARKGFLSEWGAIRWMYNARWPGLTLNMDGASARMVVPEYLDPALRLQGAALERDMLRNAFPNISEVPAESLAVTNFLSAEAAGCGLIHFACHGEAQQRAVLQSDLLMSGAKGGDGKILRDALTANQVKVRTRLAKDAPSGLVFINACQTGRTGEGIAGVSGFADSFIRPTSGRGAAAFVGALWSVDDKLALEFARTFYASLNSGETLIKAVAAAREACKAKSDFSWLAYTVYGNPMARSLPAS